MLKQISSDWQCIKFGDVILDLKGGGTPSTTNQDFWNGDIPWTRSAVIKNKYITNGEKMITKEALQNSATNLIPKDNLLVATRVSIGNVGINKIDVAISQDLTGVIVDKTKIDVEYLYWFLLKSKQLLASLAQGSTIKGITKEDLKGVELSVPPLHEQQKIASILSRVDDLIQKTDESIEQTRRLKKGLMQTLLTKGIRHTKFKTISSYFGRFEQIPESWTLRQLSEIGEIVGGGTPDTKIDDYWNGQIPWAVPTDITHLSTIFIEATERRITEKGLSRSAAKLLPPGTLLITSRATVGECAINIVSMATNQGFQSLVCNVNNHNLFMLYAMQYHKKRLVAAAYGTTFLEITKSEIKKIRIPSPPLQEQKQIADVLTEIDRLLEKKNEERVEFVKLKKGLMQKLLTGQIRVKV